MLGKFHAILFTSIPFLLIVRLLFLYRFNSRFINRVAQRRHVLDLAVLFYTHLAEVTAWLVSLRRHLLKDLNFSTGTPSLEDTQVNQAGIVI